MGRKKDGFKDEKYIIIPTESFQEYAKHPMIKTLYLTDVGLFPNALNHYREREEGIDEYILIYCLSGEGYIQVENKTYTIKEKNAFCIPRNVKHLYYSNEKNPWSILWVHFKGENTKFFPLEDCKIVNVSFNYANNRIMFLFDLLFRVLERNYTLGNYIYISQVLSLILSEIYFREKVDDTNKQNSHMTMVIRYMYKHMNENLTLEDISKELRLSKSYINAIFKKNAKKAPIEFFIHLKMQEACKLLKSTNMCVYEIGNALGYEDPYYFSRIFKKVVGVSPKFYKNSEYYHLEEL